MTRDEFAWLVVRAVGAFVLLLVTLDVISMALSAMTAVGLHNRIDSVPFNSDESVRLTVDYARQVARVKYLGIEVFFKAGIAMYCFYRGALIHRLLLSRLPSAKET